MQRRVAGIIHIQLIDRSYFCVQKDAPAAGICLAPAPKYCCKHEGIDICDYHRDAHDQTAKLQALFLVN